MRIIFLQPELMHAYIRAKNFEEKPQVYVNKRAMVYDFKETGVLIKYTDDHVGLGANYTHVYYQDTVNDPVDKVQLGCLILEGLIPVDLTNINLLDI